MVISFDYSQFLAKNLAYAAECPIMKFHYRNSSIADKSEVDISQNLLVFSEYKNFINLYVQVKTIILYC